MDKINKKLLVLVGLILIILSFNISSIATADIFNKSISKSVGNMVIPRSGHSTFLMNDGRVLVVGGSGPSTYSAEIYDPKTKKFKLAGKLNQWRSHEETITMLKNGKVLITGGSDGIKQDFKSAELFDPQTGKSENLEDMHFYRTGHTATLLQDGKVLIVGGIKKAELFDPETNKFSIIPNEMIFPHYNHSSILLNDGNILIVGGPTDLAEIFYPKTNKFKEVGKMNFKRTLPILIPLENNKIFVFGGYDPDTKFVSKSEIYDISSGTFYIPKIDKYPDNKENRLAIKVDEDKILFVGGCAGLGTAFTQLSDIYLLDLEAGSYKFLGSMKNKRDLASVTRLNKYNYLVTGGWISYKTLSSAEIINLFNIWEK